MSVTAAAGIAIAQPSSEPTVQSPARTDRVGAPYAAGRIPPGSVTVPVRPPPINVEYLQFGMAFTAALNLNPGAICPENATVPCILGSGGGLVARAGYRSRGPWYLGGAYEFNRVDTASLMRLGVLQQVRAEMRYYLALGSRVEPYFTSSAGGVAFGNEWGLEALGLTTSGGFGFEVQLSRTTVVGAAAVYRPILLFGWTDRAGQPRDTGIAHFFGFEVVLEAREPLGSH